jgi:hypothetical protein
MLGFCLGLSLLTPLRRFGRLLGRVGSSGGVPAWFTATTHVLQFGGPVSTTAVLELQSGGAAALSTARCGLPDFSSLGGGQSALLGGFIIAAGLAAALSLLGQMPMQLEPEKWGRIKRHKV